MWLAPVRAEAGADCAAPGESGLCKRFGILFVGIVMNPAGYAKKVYPGNKKRKQKSSYSPRRIIPHQSCRQGAKNKIVQDSINSLNDKASDRDWCGVAEAPPAIHSACRSTQHVVFKMHIFCKYSLFSH